MSEIANFLVAEIGLGTVLLWLALAALIRSGGRWRIGLAVALGVYALPLTSWLAAVPLDASTHSAADIDRLPAADAVIVFGAGVYADDIGGNWPSSGSVRRAALGLAAARALGTPLVISGGKANPDLAAEADVIGRVLPLDVPTVFETSSRTTQENARFVMEAAGERRWGPVILVTSRTHTRRAAGALRSAGGEVAAVLGAGAARAPTIMDVIPSVKGLRRWPPLMHEYLGLGWYLVNGAIQPGDLTGASER